MTPRRYRLTVSLTANQATLGEFHVPAGTIVIPATAMAGPDRVALAEETSGRIIRTFPTEIEREFWITKNAKLEL